MILFSQVIWVDLGYVRKMCSVEELSPCNFLATLRVVFVPFAPEESAVRGYDLALKGI